MESRSLVDKIKSNKSYGIRYHLSLSILIWPHPTNLWFTSIKTDPFKSKNDYSPIISQSINVNDNDNEFITSSVKYNDPVWIDNDDHNIIHKFAKRYQPHLLTVFKTSSTYSCCYHYYYYYYYY